MESIELKRKAINDFIEWFTPNPLFRDDLKKSAEEFIDHEILLEEDEVELSLSIDSESVDIYVDNGDDEPIHVCYWHIEEVEEDANVAISMCNAIDLYYRNPQELIDKVNGIHYDIDEDPIY